MKTAIFLLILCPIVSFSQDFQRFEQELLTQINELRAKKRRAPLEYEPKYQPFTDAWAKHIINGARHDSSTKYWGEVCGNFLVQELIVEQFFSSECHKAALMDKEAKKICISIFVTPPKKYIEKGWTVDQPTLYNVVMRTYR